MIYKGETFTLKATFKNDDGDLTDPTTPVKVYAKNYDGTVAIDGQSATKDSTGVYKYEYTAQVVGMLSYSFQSGDGAVETGQVKICKDTSK